jgi:GrpB-like predicted nucleotidyltransferase (UPF0157 family)
MLTKEQEKWVNHLSNDSKIKIIPFNPSCQEKFEKVKKIIQSKLGETIKVKHRGASSLGISGQDEIDVYVPVPANNFNNFINPLTELFGNPKSHYPLERVRFVTFESGKHVDIFLVNKEHKSWSDSLKFEKYLRSSPETLEEYRKLKESGNGLGTREYYQKKIEFFNDVLGRI